MIKVAICDDDIATTGKIEDMLCRIAKRNFIPIETEVFWEGEHLSEAVESMDNFDVIFLDIEMGQADGITVARKIRETDKNVLIIYVTSHERQVGYTCFYSSNNEWNTTGNLFCTESRRI